MRIVINALTRSTTSIPTFFRNILPELDRATSDHTFAVVASADDSRLLEAIPPSFEIIPVRALFYGMDRILWEQLVLPGILRRWAADILYASGNLVTVAANCRTVTTITNAAPFTRLAAGPGAAERLRHALLRGAAAIATQRAHRVIFLTENSRSILGPRLGLSPDRTGVMPYGVAPTTPGTAVPPPCADYVLTVGVLFEYKNLDRLMQAFDRIAHRYAGHLVIAGPCGSPLYYKRLARRKASLAHGKRILFTDRLGPERLASAYRHARAFVFPSLVETFGLPLLEAMNWGLPIAASDAMASPEGSLAFTPARELCQDAALYFNPFDLEQMVEAIERVVFDDSVRRLQKRYGPERARHYGWDAAAAALLRILESSIQMDR